MNNRKSTFGEILKQIGAENSERLMTKARLANRLAKRAQGKNRRNAYAAKATALSSLVKNLPETVCVSRDNRLTDFVVVGLRNQHFGLHLPISFLTNA